MVLDSTADWKRALYKSPRAKEWTTPEFLPRSCRDLRIDLEDRNHLSPRTILSQASEGREFLAMNENVIDNFSQTAICPRGCKLKTSHYLAFKS
jgi:hypothetical protein